MSTATELRKNWEGRVVDEQFPLRQWLGGSDHSDVFLTQRTGTGSQKAVIKLIRTEGLDEAAQLSRWASAAKLSHPHLLRLFECGRCMIDGTRLLYVVMEFADENLAEILPLRALSPSEVSELLRPTAEALAYLHGSGFAHGRIRPSNIMAIDNRVKISADSLRQIGERDKRIPATYDAPEVAATGASPASDMWSLGATLVAIMTQREMQIDSKGGWAAIPYQIPQPFYRLAQLCLRFDPRARCTASDILSQVQSETFPARAGVSAKTGQTHIPQARPKRWIVVPIVVAAILLVAWAGSKFMGRQPAIPAAGTHTAPPSTPTAQSPAPFSESKKPAQKGIVRGSVLQQVQPDVSRSAQNTINGHVKVSIQASVDASGNVSQAKFVSAGPSRYFAERALAAARKWKFTPPQVEGQAAASEWILRFQFGRTNIQAFPSEIKP